MQQGIDLFNRLHYRPYTQNYDMGVAYDAFVATALWMAVVFIVDQVMARRFVGRYFALHAFMNLAVNVYLNYKDTVLFFQDPSVNSAFCAPGGPCASLHPPILTNAVHLSHIIVHFNALTRTDWIHHTPALIVCTFSYFFPFGPALCACNMALMGIPGGIDYAMLTCCKQGWLDWGVEKSVNKDLNMWLRGPAGVITGFLIMAAVFLSPSAFGTPHTLHQKIYFFIFGLHAYWNGAFFGWHAIDAHTRYVAKMKASKQKAA